jgi:transcriptional regulator with XRE-family HTH domain
MTLEQLRTERAFGKSEVARELGVSITAVDNWEKGKSDPLPVNLRGLAKLYAVSIEEVRNAIAATKEQKTD